MEEQQRTVQLTEVMDMYGDYIVRLCYTYVRDWQTAEDLAQDTFLKFYAALPQFRGDAAVKTYLFRIAVNVCHNYLASWKYKKVHISNVFQSVLTTNNSPETALLQLTEQQQLAKAIEALPTKYKDVLVLYHFVEMPLQDVANALKLPLNTVKTRLRRARQMLGLTLQEEGTLYGSD